jgi:hypothetical protein
MKTSTISKAAYEQTFGPLLHRCSVDTLEIWRKIQKLPVTEYMVFEPEKGQSLDTLRNGMWGRLRRFLPGSNFKIRFAVNKNENHVVLWKEARVQPGKLSA